MLESFMDAVWEAVEDEGYDKDKVTSNVSNRDNVHVRTAISQLLFYRLGVSYAKITQILDSSHLSTINYYVNKMDRRNYEDYRKLVKVLNKVADRYEEYLAKFK